MLDLNFNRKEKKTETMIIFINQHDFSSLSIFNKATTKSATIFFYACLSGWIYYGIPVSVPLSFTFLYLLQNSGTKFDKTFVYFLLSIDMSSLWISKTVPPNAIKLWIVYFLGLKLHLDFYLLFPQEAKFWGK